MKLEPPPAEVPESPAPGKLVHILIGRDAPALAVTGEPRSRLAVGDDLVLDRVPLTRRLFVVVFTLADARARGNRVCRALAR